MNKTTFKAFEKMNKGQRRALAGHPGRNGTKRQQQDAVSFAKLVKPLSSEELAKLKEMGLL